MHGPLKIGCIFTCNENNPVRLIYLYNVLRWQREVSRSQANTCYPILLLLGYVVAQLVEVLRYKLEGRWFDFRWCHWNFSLALSFRPHYGPGVDSASNRNGYQDYFRGVGVKTAGA